MIRDLDSSEFPILSRPEVNKASTNVRGMTYASVSSAATGIVKTDSSVRQDVADTDHSESVHNRRSTENKTSNMNVQQMSHMAVKQRFIGLNNDQS